jgi:hypothetical protein
LLGGKEGNIFLKNIVFAKSNGFYWTRLDFSILLDPIVGFGGEVFVQSTPGFILGIRENAPRSF